MLNELRALWARITGTEPAVQKITRKQTRIDVVVNRETQAIQAAVQGELAAISSFARNGLKRIDDLMGTGALDSTTASQVDRVRKAFSNASVAL